MTYQHFYEVWTAACARVGITDLHPHCLRHTGATRYYWSNPDQIAVSRRCSTTPNGDHRAILCQASPRFGARSQAGFR